MKELVIVLVWIAAYTAWEYFSNKKQRENDNL